MFFQKVARVSTVKQTGQKYMSVRESFILTRKARKHLWAHMVFKKERRPSPMRQMRVVKRDQNPIENGEFIDEKTPFQLQVKKFLVLE